jgi:hypothetical protein
MDNLHILPRQELTFPSGVRCLVDYDPTPYALSVAYSYHLSFVGKPTAEERREAEVKADDLWSQSYHPARDRWIGQIDHDLQAAGLMVGLSFGNEGDHSVFVSLRGHGLHRTNSQVSVRAVSRILDAVRTQLWNTAKVRSIHEDDVVSLLHWMDEENLRGRFDPA